MVPRMHARGSSFKGASVYLLHDKQQGQNLGTSFKGAAEYLLHDKHATTSDRVAWTHKENLFSNTVDDAWFEMMDTWRDRNALKKAAGFKTSGRDNKAPVLHMSLSWHPDETPSADHMRETALAALKALGLQEHQALIVAHKDEPQPHVHLLINTVHPVTGKTADLKHSKNTLSRWAEAYEREHGQIRCEQRVKNNARRDALRQERGAEREASKAFARAVWQGMKPEKAPAPPKPYEPVNDNSPSRRQWLDRQEIIDRMKALRAGQTADQKVERDTLWLQQQAKLNALDHETKGKVDQIRQNVREHYRPEWKQLYRSQQAERRYLTKAATHPFERACYVFANRGRLAGPGKPLTLGRMAALIVSPKRLMQTVGRMHERERQGLAQVEKTHQKGLTDKVWMAHRERYQNAQAHYRAEREELAKRQAATKTQFTWADARAALEAEKAAAREQQPQRAAPSPSPAAPQPSRVDEVNQWIRDIQDMRKRGRGRDTRGREME